MELNSMQRYKNSAYAQIERLNYLRTDSNAKLQPNDTAELDYGRMLAMARAMPDASSAVLVVLWWHASYQTRLRNIQPGSPLIARMTPRQLAVATSRSTATIAACLQTLKQRGLIEVYRRPPGGDIAEYRICALAMRARSAPKASSLGAYGRPTHRR
jgi:hypothetical protein